MRLWKSERLMRPILAILLCCLTGCETPIPESVDGVPVSRAEAQAARSKRVERRRHEWLATGGPFTIFLGPTIVNTLHLAGVDVGHNNPKNMEDDVRRVRQTKQERESLSAQLDTAKAYNNKLAAVCAELLNEVNDLKGRPHATLDQKKDLLKQIQRQTERASSASKQTDAALEKSRQVRAGLVSSGKGKGELKAYDGEIEKLEARKRQLAGAIANLARQRSEVSS